MEKLSWRTQAARNKPPTAGHTSLARFNRNRIDVNNLRRFHSGIEMKVKQSSKKEPPQICIGRKKHCVDESGLMRVLKGFSLSEILNRFNMRMLWAAQVLFFIELFLLHSSSDWQLNNKLVFRKSCDIFFYSDSAPHIQMWFYILDN